MLSSRANGRRSALFSRQARAKDALRRISRFSPSAGPSPAAGSAKPAAVSHLVAVIRIYLFRARAHVFFRLLDVGLGLIADSERGIADDSAVNRQSAGANREHRLGREVAGRENYRQAGQDGAEPAPEAFAFPKCFFHFFTIYAAPVFFTFSPSTRRLCFSASTRPRCADWKSATILMSRHGSAIL